MLDEVKSNGPVNLIGDGRCDSPGHNAKYCIYTMMTDEGKVAAITVVRVTEVTSSNAREKEGVREVHSRLCQRRSQHHENCHRPPYFYLKFHEKGPW